MGELLACLCRCSALLIVPWVLAFAALSPNVLVVLKAASTKELWYCYLCGAAWGVGGLTWGLMIRYLGVGLGLAIGCGLCSAAGTLIPPILAGNLGKLYGSPAANMSLIGRAGVPGGHRAGRHGGHVQGEGTARGGEEEGRSGVQLQEGHPGCPVLRPDELCHGFWAGRRTGHPETGGDHGSGHVP